MVTGQALRAPFPLPSTEHPLRPGAKPSWLEPLAWVLSHWWAWALSTVILGKGCGLRALIWPWGAQKKGAGAEAPRLRTAALPASSAGVPWRPPAEDCLISAVSSEARRAPQPYGFASMTLGPTPGERTLHGAVPALAVTRAARESTVVNRVPSLSLAAVALLLVPLGCRLPQPVSLPADQDKSQSMSVRLPLNPG